MPRPQPLATLPPPLPPCSSPSSEVLIDVIGDIRGECGTLCELLDRLGYDGNGAHPEGRRLVFVGDLIDRGGPDVPTPPAWRGGWRGTSSSRYAVRRQRSFVYMPCSGC